MGNDARAIVAGLNVGWQTFRTPPGEGSADDGEIAFGLWVPDNPDGLLDQLSQEEFDRTDERLPYFATVWASAEALVTYLLDGDRLDGRHVLDLGCGLGPCGFAAAHRGARVTFLDWEPRALEIVAASAHEQEAFPAMFAFVLGDWRAPPRLGPFDLILGADVLYERRNAAPVAAFLATHLKPGAEAWITDPARPQAEDFPAQAERAGLGLIERRTLPPTAEGVAVTLLRLRWPAGSAPG